MAHRWVIPPLRGFAGVYCLFCYDGLKPIAGLYRPVGAEYRPVIESLLCLRIVILFAVANQHLLVDEE